MSAKNQKNESTKKKAKLGQPVENECFLNEGENILWEGNPADFKVVSPQSRNELIVKWILVPIFLLVLLVLHFKLNDSPNMGLVIGIILLMVFIAASVLLKKRKIMKCRYLLTDQRVLLVNNYFAYFIRFEDFDGFRVVRDQTENPSIVFGSQIYGDIQKRLLWRAASDISTEDTFGDEASCYNLVFYNTVNADNLIEKLHELGIKEN